MGLDDNAQEREIDGFTYRVWPVPFGAGKRILLMVLRAFGAAASAPTDAARITAILTALSDREITDIENVFGAASQYGVGVERMPMVRQGKIDNFEMHFAGRYDAYVRWLLLAAEVNYSCFFDGAKRQAIVDDARRLMPETKPATTPTS